MKLLVCSIAPTAFLIDRHYQGAVLNLPACKKGEKYVSAWVEDQEDARILIHDLRNKERIKHHIPASEVMRDIMTSEALEREGVWVAAGNKPTEQEIAEAHAKRNAYLVKCITEGDALFAQHGPRGVALIPDYAKRAVIEREETRPWVFTGAEQRVQCEGCGTDIKFLKDGSKPAVCATCGAILDVEKAARLGLSRQADTAQGKRPN